MPALVHAVAVAVGVAVSVSADALPDDDPVHTVAVAVSVSADTLPAGRFDDTPVVDAVSGAVAVATVGFTDAVLVSADSLPAGRFDDNPADAVTVVIVSVPAGDDDGLGSPPRPSGSSIEAMKKWILDPVSSYHPL